MLLLIKPYLGCNMNCTYCYEKKYREKVTPKMEYNLSAIFKRMEELRRVPSVLHGGEPLMLPKKDVEKILKKSKELRGESSIHTNGLLIDDEYIDIFKKYNTQVGVSFDGPGELSKYRPGGARIEKTIEKLVAAGINTSLIMVISRANAGTPRLLKKLKNYLLALQQMNFREGRINPCGGTLDRKQELPAKRLTKVYLDLADFCLRNNLKWSPFRDIIHGLIDKNRVCTFMGCDPFSTSSAAVVVDDGTITNCMRTNQKNILIRHPIQRNTRSELLSETLQEFGGCKGCKYWSACRGGCPTITINNDWRNRTYLCSTWRALFQFYEKILPYFGLPMNFWATGEKPPARKQLNQKNGRFC